MIESTSVAPAERASLEEYLRAVLSPAQLERVMILSFNQWEIATNVVAEVASTLHDMGTQPIIGLWANDTPLKDVGWTTSRGIARLLLSPSRDARVRKALRAYGLPSQAFVRPPLRHWQPAEVIPESDRLYRTGIREMTYRSGEVGRAILQVHPDRETPVTDEHLWPPTWIQESLRSYAWVYDQAAELIREQRATAAVVLNGRFLHDAAVAAASAEAHLPVLAFDFGGNDTDFDLTIDDTHDWSALQKRMLTMYEMWEPTERDELGSRWFEERRSHLDPRNSLFVESQEAGAGYLKPPGTRLVTYFSSSGDEISELDLDWNEYFNGQPQALRALAEACRQEPNTILLVRTHPHLRMKPKRDVEEWHEAVEAAGPQVHFDEHSPIDSYTLMRQSDVVVTYGSTTGVEAAYAGCPVVVMGPSAYDELGCAVRVTTIAELRKSLRDPGVGVRSGAISYGLMMLRRGFRNTHVRRIDQKTSELAGVHLRDARELVLKLSHTLVERERQRMRTS